MINYCSPIENPSHFVWQDWDGKFLIHGDFGEPSTNIKIIRPYRNLLTQGEFLLCSILTPSEARSPL